MTAQSKEKHREYMRKWCALNADRDRENKRKWRELNRETILQRKKDWRMRNAERIAAAKREYRTKNAEIIAVRKKEFRLANLERLAVYDHEYRIKNKEKTSAYYKMYRAENIDRLRASDRLRWAKRRSIGIIRDNPDDVYRTVSKAVSSALPSFMRDDVISAMLMAVLEGELLLGNVAARVKDYLGRYNRQYDTFKTLSLDAPMGGTDVRRIDLLEAPAAYDGEEDEDEYQFAEERSPGGIIICRR